MNLLLDGRSGSEDQSSYNDRPSVLINMDGAVPTLDLSDDKGKVRARLTTNADGAAFIAGGIGVAVRVVEQFFYGTHNSGPGLLLFDEDGKTRATLGVFKDVSWLDMFDLTGKTIWKAP